MAKIYRFERPKKKSEVKILSKEELENDFIEMLRKEILIKKPKCDLVRIRYTNEKAELLDRWYRPIEINIKYDYGLYDLTDVDIMLLNLLEIAPKQVDIIECVDNTLFNVLRKIFQGKILRG